MAGGLTRQNTMEFLGRLLRGTSSSEAVVGDGVDDGRVGVVVEGDENDAGAMGSGRRQRRGASSSTASFAPDPFTLPEVLGRLDSARSLLVEDENNAAGETRKETTKTTRSNPTRKSSRRAKTNAPAATVTKGASGRRGASSSAAGGALARVNAQHSSSDAGDHHGWTYIPKRADRRRAIARFTTAIIRAAGHASFISREGVGYRKAFDRFLVETYGETFEEGHYWYKNAEIEPFFRAVLYVASDGRLNLANDDVKYLFTKKEERQAAEWVLDEDVLGKLGMTARDVANVYEGQPRKSSRGFPRGTPLNIPPETTLPPEPEPFLESMIRGGGRGGGRGAAEAAPATAFSMPPPPSRSRTPQIPTTGGANAVPMDIQKLFASIPPLGAPGTPLTRGLSRQISRQYSSDLSRLMSEFEAHPSHADEFVRTYLARSASELDAVAALQNAEKADGRRASKRTRTRDDDDDL